MFKNIEVLENARPEVGRPLLKKMDSNMTNLMEQQMLLSQANWNNDGLNQEIER